MYLNSKYKVLTLVKIIQMVLPLVPVHESDGDAQLDKLEQGVDQPL